MQRKGAEGGCKVAGPLPGNARYGTATIISPASIPHHHHPPSAAQNQHTNTPARPGGGVSWSWSWPWPQGGPGEDPLEQPRYTCAIDEPLAQQLAADVRLKLNNYLMYDR